MGRLVERNVAVLLLYNDDGNVLLQHRSEDALRFPGFWGFFGGGIEENETPGDALIREIREELGYEITNPEYFGAMEFTAAANEGKIFLFLERFDASQKIVQREGQGMGWFDPLKLSDLKVIPHDKPIIESAGKSIRQKASNGKV
ncbi:MAG TPA: NUDIX domain-containing protein [Candidatus Paceibacterota bacterium]|jgi:mutator protein MutT|nr:NUDIX domain-containing protein [Candidatus Paceibacterota bacterium]